MPLHNVQHLGYVILLCDDLVKMRDFYQNVLDLKINDETEDWIEIFVGSTLLSLRPRGAGTMAYAKDRVHQFNCRFGLHHPMLTLLIRLCKRNQSIFASHPRTSLLGTEHCILKTLREISWKYTQRSKQRSNQSKGQSNHLYG